MAYKQIFPNINGINGILFSEPESDRPLPLIISFDGTGQIGTAISKLNDFAITKYAIKDCIVVVPQFTSYTRNTAVFFNLMSWCFSNFNVDKGRVYLAGLSDGGSRIAYIIEKEWNFNGKKVVFASLIKAVIVMCGGIVFNSSIAAVMKKNNVAAWFFHNEYDPTIPLSYTVNSIKNLTAAGVEVVSKIFTGVRVHDCWTKALNPVNVWENGMNVYQWLLNHPMPAVDIPVPTPAPTPDRPILGEGIIAGVKVRLYEDAAGQMKGYDGWYKIIT